MLRWHPCLLAGDIRGSQGDVGPRVRAGWGVGVSGDPEEAGRPRSCGQGSSQQPRELWAPSWGWRPGGGRPTSVGGTGADTGCRPVPRTRVRSAERGPDAVAGGRPCVREKPESAALQPSVTWCHCCVSDGARPGAEAPAPLPHGAATESAPARQRGVTCPGWPWVCGCWSPSRACQEKPPRQPPTPLPWRAPGFKPTASAEAPSPPARLEASTVF